MARRIRSSIPASSTPMPRRWKRRLKTRSPSRLPPRRKRRDERRQGLACVEPRKVVNAKLPKVNLGSNNRRVMVRNNAIRINFADRINQSFVFYPHDLAGVGSLVGQV